MGIEENTEPEKKEDNTWKIASIFLACCLCFEIIISYIGRVCHW